MVKSCLTFFVATFVLFFAGLTSYAQTHYEIPQGKSDEQIVEHFAYTLSYNERHEQANWVAYLLTRQRASAQENSRTDKFITDPAVKSGSATNDDYAKSGYDRGHLAPAADMSWSETAMKESFYYSNMSPQVPGFNRGVWKRLEEQVRQWAVEYDTLYIVTGPILPNRLPSIGPNKVSVPKKYYKAILRISGTDTTAIALILPNASSQNELSSFVVTVNKLEKTTGIDFFPALPDATEERIERKTCVKCWRWK